MLNERKPLEKTLFYYISAEFLIGFGSIFGVVFFLFFINQIIVEIQELLSRDISFFNTIKLVFYASPVLIALTFPYAALLGTLFSVGRLSGDNELVAFQALGINLPRLFFPIFLWSIVIAFLSFCTHNYLTPFGLQKFREKFYQISQESPEVVFSPYSIRKVDNSWMIIPDVDKEGANGILIIDTAENGDVRIINSSKAKLLQGKENSSYISVGLDKSFILNSNMNPKEYSYTFSDTITYNILFELASRSASRVRDIEKSIFEVAATIKQLSKEQAIGQNSFDYSKSLDRAEYINDFKNENIKSLNENRLKNIYSYVKNINYEGNIRGLQSYRYTFWEKIYQSLMCLVFPFFGFSSGVFFKRSGKALNVGLGGVISVLYYISDTLLKTMSVEHLNINPAIYASLPIGFFFFISVILFYFRVFK